MNALQRSKAAMVMLGLLFGSYLLCTPSGAVRLAIAVNGHPLAALCCHLEKGFVGSSLEAEDRLPMIEMLPFHATVQAPYESVTDSSLENWAAYRLGLVCVGRYWGYL